MKTALSMWGTALWSMVATISLLGLCAPTLALDSETANTPDEAWLVQLGSFGEEQNARRLADRVATFGLTARVFPSTSNGRPIFRVRVGPTSSRQSAAAVATFLSANGFDQPWVLNEPGQVVAYVAEPSPAPASTQTITPVTQVEATTTPAPLAAQNQGIAQASMKTLEAVRTNEPITVDGRLDESVWLQAAVVDDFHQITPIEYAEPSQQTRFLVLYDNEALYVAARMYDDEPERVTANVLRQGGSDSWRDDQFNVILDPFNDKRNGYHFQLNPNGVREEGLFKGPTAMQWQWDGIWQAGTTQDDQGWIAEVRIPFKTLSFDPEGDTWGINFNRRVARVNEEVGWVSRNRTQSPAISGELTNLIGLEQGIGLDVVPSIVMNERREFLPFSEESVVEPSLDVFYKITPALSAALTLNTDFSATEVDDRQVNLTRFGLFFPEQRDFFLQDADIFEFGRLGQREYGSPFSSSLSENGRPFFSRRIGLSTTGQPVDLTAGGKLTGRVGRWNIGTLAIQQEAFEDIQSTDLFVGRVTANVLAESSIGFIVTDGDPQSNLDNSLVGMDFGYQNTRLPNGSTLESELWYQQTETEGLTGENSAWGARLWMPNRNGFRGGAGIKEIEGNFNPALGFINRKDIRDLTTELGYTYRPSGLTLRSVYGGSTVQRIEHLAGGLQSQNATLLVNLENQTGDQLNFTYQNDKEGLVEPFEISEGIVIPPGDYSFDQTSVGINTGYHRRIVTNLSYGTGNFYDGDRNNITAQIVWMPTPHFRTLISYQYDDVELTQGDFKSRLARLGLDAIYSAKLSWTNLLQYDNATETLGINSRIHWIPQAGREMFIVLNHNLEDLDLDNRFHSAVSDFSFKFNYTFRF